MTTPRSKLPFCIQIAVSVIFFLATHLTALLAIVAQLIGQQKKYDTP